MADSVSSLDLATLHMASLDITQDEVAETDTDTNGSASDRTKNANSVITAVEAVFNTTELLEHIIDYLHMRQMFAIQRVSRNWKDIVRTSPRVQARLRTYMFSNEVISPSNLNHLGDSFARKNACFVLYQIPLYTAGLQLNPCVKWTYQADYHMNMTGTHGIDVSCFSGAIFCVAKRHRDYVYNIVGSLPLVKESRDDMFLTSPPITTVKLYLSAPNDKGVVKSLHKLATVTASGGVTVGLAKAEVEKARQGPSDIHSDQPCRFVRRQLMDV